MENWEWADRKFSASKFFDIFDTDNCDYDFETGDHNYFNEAGDFMVSVTADGTVVMRETKD